MGIESIVNAVVSATSTRVSQQGFGTPLLLGVTARAGADLVRYYNSLAAVAADYATSTPEYKAAARIFSQVLRPARVAIAKRTRLPTQRFTFTPVAANNTRYAWRLGTEVVEYTSDSSATLAEITAGLVAAFTTLATALGEDAPAVTVADVGGTAVRQTAVAAGSWFDVQVLTPAVLHVVQDSADAGVTDDLDDIHAAQPDWYGLLTLFPSQAETMAIAAWTEANRKLFFYASVDAAMRTDAYDPEDADATVGGALKSRNYVRSFLFPQASTGDFADAAAMGYFLATAPGSSTLHLKQLVGVPALTLTPNEETNLKSYNANVISLLGGLTVVQDGVGASGSYLDLARDTDWLVARTRERVFARLAQPGKVPMTDAGVALLSSEVAGQAQEAEQAGFLAPGWTVSTVPVEEVSEADRGARRYPGLQLTARYAGAIHVVDPLTITLSV